MTAPFKIGLVGLDTSHCVAFTQILQDGNFKYYLPGAQVVGVYPGGSQAFSLSRDRVRGFTEQLQSRYGLPLYDSLEGLAADVDGLMLLSGDGRQHLEQFRSLACGKPVFIDKPLATKTGDAGEILRLAAQTGTPVQSCSSLRFAAGIAGPLEQGEALVACESFGPAPVYADYPGLYWYGIHGIEILFSWMGAGCRSVRSISHPQMDVLIGEWDDGRLGIYRGTRFEGSTFGCLLHTTRGAAYRQARDEPPFYSLLLKEVLDFFLEGKRFVSPEEMFAVIACIEAAHSSVEHGGQAVALKRLDA
jgi:predicted dehydrogenase